MNARQVALLAGAGLMLATIFLATPVTAAGTNQYTSGTASSEGLCHGAFANTNGNFAWISTEAGWRAALAGEGSVGSSTGPANAESGGCG